MRHESPTYVAFDLERFAAESDAIDPTAGRGTLRRLLEAARSMPPDAKLADLVRAIKPIVPGNSDQRRVLLSILGFAGIFQIPSNSGFFRSFTPRTEREDTPWSKDDWPYPIRWWRGGFGIDPDAIAFWFG